MITNTETNGTFVQITQKLADFGVKVGDDGKLIRLDGSRIKNNAPYREWLYRLKPGEKLPRGRFFRGKRPGRPLVIMDEFHMMQQNFPDPALKLIRGFNI